jgi:hypothetical protein
VPDRRGFLAALFVAPFVRPAPKPALLMPSAITALAEWEDRDYARRQRFARTRVTDSCRLDAGWCVEHWRQIGQGPWERMEPCDRAYVARINSRPHGERTLTLVESPTGRTWTARQPFGTRLMYFGDIGRYRTRTP